jgi:hypothetical protein
LDTAQAEIDKLTQELNEKMQLKQSFVEKIQAKKDEIVVSVRHGCVSD